MTKRKGKRSKSKGITHWQYKILKALGITNVFSRKATDALAGIGKHSRQRRPSPFARAKRKKRRQMARASRRRNRRK